MTAFGVVDQSLAIIAPLVALVEGAARRLPPILGFTASAGRISAGLPVEGAPMVTGCMDAWAGLLGAGVASEGGAVHLSGTSDILGIVSEQKHPTPGVIAFPRCEGITFHAGPTQSGGASLDWAALLFNRPADELCNLAAGAAMGDASPMFLPHLDGERAPLWDAGARGAFMGLEAASGPGEAALAIMEGTAHAARWLLDSLEQSAGLRPAVLAHAGGGARADVWCQLRADVLGVPLRRLKMLDAGVAGAALLAGVGAGLFASIAEGAGRFVQVDRDFEPDTARADLLARRHARYRAFYQALKPLR
jgi:xylulokinase